MLGFLATLGLCFFLWLSHRVCHAYLRAVAREERGLYRLSQATAASGAPTPHSHLGPKLFFVLDLILLAALVAGLRTWLPFFAIKDPSSIQAGAELLMFGSVVMGLGLVSEGRLLQSFYQRMIRSVRTLRRGRAELAFEDQILGHERHDLRRVFVAGVIAWTALPPVLALFGVRLISNGTSESEALALVTAYFVLPQLALGAYLISVVRRVRHSLYH
ncbi:MAG: hypothetical protein V3W41_03715 [Planctomycetota bacterium]